MRCRRHPGDVSGDVGVCASCLRERLFSVVVARAELQQDCRRKEAQQRRQEYPSFPSSVSPYVSRTTHQRFFSTPQAGVVAAAEIRAEEEEKRRKGRGGKLSSLFWRIFRSKSDKVDPVPRRVIDSPESTKQSWTFSSDERSISAMPNRNRRNRGMSPAAVSDDEGNEHCHGGPNGYSESSRGWRQTPRRTPACPRRGSVNKGTGMSFFLSPLIRPSPSRQSKPPPDASACCDSRKTARAHLSSATSSGKSRSRKLAADWPKWNNNNY